MKLWNCGNMELSKYGNGKVPATLVACIFAYFHIPTFAYSDAVAGPARDFCGWGALAPVALPAEWPLKSN